MSTKNIYLTLTRVSQVQNQYIITQYVVRFNINVVFRKDQNLYIIKGTKYLLNLETKPSVCSLKYIHFNYLKIKHTIHKRRSSFCSCF